MSSAVQSSAVHKKSVPCVPDEKVVAETASGLRGAAPCQPASDDQRPLENLLDQYSTHGYLCAMLLKREGLFTIL